MLFRVRLAGGFATDTGEQGEKGGWRGGGSLHLGNVNHTGRNGVRVGCRGGNLPDEIDVLRRIGHNARQQELRLDLVRVDIAVVVAVSDTVVGRTGDGCGRSNPRP